MSAMNTIICAVITILGVSAVVLMPQCQYRDLLGEPNTGIHTHVAGIPIGDHIFTIASCAIVAWWLRLHFLRLVLSAYITAGIIHWYFCVETPLGRLVGI